MTGLDERLKREYDIELIAAHSLADAARTGWPSAAALSQAMAHRATVLLAALVPLLVTRWEYHAENFLGSVGSGA